MNNDELQQIEQQLQRDLMQETICVLAQVYHRSLHPTPSSLPAQAQDEGHTNFCCYGYGLWPDSTDAPMGPMDAEDGMPTKACPICGANTNPIADGEVKC